MWVSLAVELAFELPVWYIFAKKEKFLLFSTLFHIPLTP